ncbi:exopolysaccharide biosynthesis polyprenyl glycosylphosphotransferase [Caulobacter sp. S45]|uniref:exopolysaccharide biosynthesis polyprenyl glycosylphosphotransferase n=1 Tax=Caulobacter sp. S45 TaxID=1641861 RepID=UPI0020C701A2|nr:exopolysaccharide biosynthesis polyprenyl glycosylphosphotransferase [Caulobacter sp. S45]
MRSRLTGAMVRQGFRALDAAALGVALVLSVTLSHADLAQLWPCVLGAVMGFGLLPGMGAYIYAPGERMWKALARAVAGTGLAILAVLLINALVPATRPATLSWSLVSLGAIAATHAGGLACVRRWRRAGRLTPNILVVGATENAQKLIETALRTREVAVLGLFDDRSDRIPTTIHGVPVLGDTRALLQHRILPYVDRIVLTVNAAGPARTAELIERLHVLPNELCLFLDAEDPGSRSTTLSWLARSTLSVRGAKARDGRQLAKRAQDLLAGALLLVAALPVMAVIALLVRLDSPGPILFRQRRHGFNNEEILVWKFRSMRTDATDQAGARQVAVGDERVTRIGRFIRNTSLDELPQLINVLQGRMSLVGPRPHPIGMKTAGQDSHRLVAEYAWRHRMKPGITGWAQINGSRGPVNTAEEVRRRVELDVDYIERQSFWLDLYILAMTVPRLLGDGEAVR